MRGWNTMNTLTVHRYAAGSNRISNARLLDAHPKSTDYNQDDVLYFSRNLRNSLQLEATFSSCENKIS